MTILEKVSLSRSVAPCIRCQGRGAHLGWALSGQLLRVVVSELWTKGLHLVLHSGPTAVHTLLSCAQTTLVCDPHT